MDNIDLKIKKGDIFIASAVFLIAVLLMIFFSLYNKGGSLKAVILQDGKIIREIDLSSLHEAMYIEIDGKYHNIIKAENGKIRMESSNCPGEVCVHSGWIDKGRYSVVCLPNRVEIKIVGSDDVDTVVG